MYNWNPLSLLGEFEELAAIPGSGLIHGRTLSDSRGSFRKIISLLPGFHADFREIFWNVSHPRVIRGMHMGVSGNQGDKLVTVQRGEIFDALIDLRPGLSLGSIFTINLTPESPSLFIPAGVAHGFQVVSASEATVLYLTANSYIQEYDSGVNPLTCGIEWPLSPATFSPRDSALPDFAEVLGAGGWPLSTAE